jgi:hypothetical protein
LNDTGITACANATQNNLPCPQAGYPNQDAENGRDAQPNLQKVGAGPAGFDFTKLGSAGQPLPDDAPEWDCVRDNVTGLIWEVKTDDGGLRDEKWTYSWCNTDPATNGGSVGVCDTDAGVGRDTCFNPARCNTQHYASDVNALPVPLCGYADWRVPTVEELLSIADFSGRVKGSSWSATPSFFGYAWAVVFNGEVSQTGPASPIRVRLVRGGQ